MLINLKGISINSQNKKGGKFSCLELIKETPLHLAIKESQMFAFQILLKHQARLDLYTDDDKEGVMHYAVKGIGNAQQFIRALAHKSADVEMKNKFGDTPLMLARKKKLKRIEETLLEVGAKDPNVKDEYLADYSVINNLFFSILDQFENR
jgi:ankyrin repeat protein